MPTSSAMLLPRLQGRVRAWRRTSHKLGRPDDPLGGAPLTNWGKLSRNRTGEGQRQHRDFEGERKGFEGWLARNRRAPAKLHRGSKGTGLEGMGGARPVLQAENAPMGGAVPPVAKKFGSRVGESQSHAKHERSPPSIDFGKRKSEPAVRARWGKSRQVQYRTISECC